MADGCPKGYYRDRNTGRCRKSIEIKRKGIYGKGFLSEPQSEQYAKIRKEEKEEPPQLVDEQMAAENSFTYRNSRLHPAANKDLKYAESLDPRRKDPKSDPPHHSPSGQGKGGDKRMVRCGPGEEEVEGYTKADGTRVDPYCRKKHDNDSPHDRRVDSEHGREAGKAAKGGGDRRK